MVQDSLGYFVPEDEWMTGRNGDYEESVAPSESAGDRLREVLLGLVARPAAGNSSNMSTLLGRAPRRHGNNSSRTATMVGGKLQQRVLAAAHTGDLETVARLLSRLDEDED